MIVAVTLNPAVDQTIELDALVEGDTNRVAAIRWDVGGKGINVARVLKELGYEPLACGFAPGDMGRMIEDSLLDAGIGCEFTFVPGETRTNITILDRETHVHTVLAAAGPRVTEHAIAQLRSRLGRRLRPRIDSWLVLAGSIPPGADAGLYVDLLGVAADRGTRTALDADGDVVAQVLAAGAAPGPAQAQQPRGRAAARPPDRGRRGGDRGRARAAIVGRGAGGDHARGRGLRGGDAGGRHPRAGAGRGGELGGGGGRRLPRRAAVRAGARPRLGGGADDGDGGGGGDVPHAGHRALPRRRDAAPRGARAGEPPRRAPRRTDGGGGVSRGEGR